MKFISRLAEIFNPKSFNDLNVDELMSALSDVEIRKHWMFSVLEEIKEGHMRTHCALMNGNLTEKFVQESARLQAIDWVFRQILNSKTSVEMARHNQADDELLNGVAVQPIL